MRELTWPGPKIDKRSPSYEWAYMKAALEGSYNGDAALTYEKMFGDEPKKGAPYWLVRLAVYYGALQIGHTRTKRKMAGVEQRMLACVAKLDEKLLRNSPDLWHHLCLHDLEPAEFSGRELVS